MNFSDMFKQSDGLCQFSPNGLYLANATQFRLIVRDVKTLQIANVFACLDTIQQIDWSPDSQFLLCGMYKRGIVQLWSMEQPEWTCKIDEGSAGLTDVRWSPDSRHVLTTADFHLRITVWSLVNKSVSYIKYPKPCTRGMDFSNNGKYLALAERRDCKDFVSVFDCSSWQLVKNFDPTTDDLAGLQWSPDSRVLCVWDSCLQYKVMTFSADGSCLSTYSAYEWALGVKSVSWSPSSQFLAIGSYDEKIRLLNHITWRLITDFSHPTSVDCSTGVVVYQEVINNHSGSVTQSAAPSSYETRPKTSVVQIPITKPDVNKANPRIGISLISFSSNCRYLLTKNDNMPGALWIWDIVKLKLCSVVLHDAAIKCAVWDPILPRLALCSGTNKVYMWSLRGALSVSIPYEATFTVQSLRWNPTNSDSLLIIGKDQMCVCYFSEEKD